MNLTNINPEDLEKYIKIQSALVEQENNADRIKMFRDYYNGVHPVLLTERQKTFIGSIVTDSDEYTINHNVCEIVVDTIADHLSIDDAHGEGEDVNNLLLSVVEGNDFDLLSANVHEQTLVDGSCFVMVDFDGQMPVLSIQTIFDGETGIVETVDPSNTANVLYYTKYFYSHINITEDKIEYVYRRTVYLKDQIRKYYQDPSGDWLPYTDEDLEWPILWPEDIGFFIVKFSNKEKSELHSIIPLQNLLNKSWIDLIAAADAHGFTVPVVEYPIDETIVQFEDETVTTPDLTLNPATMLEITGGKVKNLDAGDLSGLIEVIWSVTTAISSVSKIPQNMLRPVGVSSTLSGASTAQLMEPLFKRVEKKQKLLYNSWHKVFVLAVKIHNNYTNSSIPFDGIQIHWSDIREADETVSIERAKFLSDLGLPMTVILEALEYNAEEITHIEYLARNSRANEINTIARAINTNGNSNAPQQEN